MFGLLRHVPRLYPLTHVRWGWRRGLWSHRPLLLAMHTFGVRRRAMAFAPRATCQRELNGGKVAGLLVVLASCLFAFAPHVTLANDSACEVKQYDVVVYGGTSAGITTAIQAKKVGRSVVIVAPVKHLGGMTTSGLGWTDVGLKATIGGLSLEFYQRIYRYYQCPKAWKWQDPVDYDAEYGYPEDRNSIVEETSQAMWAFEPHVAEEVFDSWLAEVGVDVVRDAWLDRERGVEKVGTRIASITTLDGRRFTGRVFVDATFEGDLLAAAGVSYHTGREANDVYDEKWNGIQVGVLHHKHHFGVLDRPVYPYRTPGDPSSGLLPLVSSEPPGVRGEGDHRIQAYNFRMCLTNHPENRAAFPKPEGYDPDEYELLLRVYDAGWKETFYKFDPLPNHKTDTNNHGPLSTDYVGMNYDYPEASYERRREIVKDHRRYQQGLMYFMANDPRMPKKTQDRMKEWGLPKDEFVDNGHWPHQIYVREARRMVGAYVMTEHDCFNQRDTPKPVGMGSYTLDSHNVQRYVTPEGYVQNEGDLGVRLAGPYEVSYDALTPKRDECTNLLVPVCLSSSHTAFGSIRMEPVFMILGQSAGAAAALAAEGQMAVQDVPYETLKQRLLADGQILEVADLSE